MLIAEHPLLVEALDLFSFHLPPKIDVATGLALACILNARRIGRLSQCLDPRWKNQVEELMSWTQETGRLLTEAQPRVWKLRPRLAKARASRGPFRVSGMICPDAHTAALELTELALHGFDLLRKGFSPTSESLHFLTEPELQDLTEEISHEANRLADDDQDKIDIAAVMKLIKQLASDPEVSKRFEETAETFRAPPRLCRKTASPKCKATGWANPTRKKSARVSTRKHSGKKRTPRSGLR